MGTNMLRNHLQGRGEACWCCTNIFPGSLTVVNLVADGYKMFFEHLLEHQVPLLIFSAGVGDMLEEVIRQNQVFHPSVHIIANYLDFDQSVSMITRTPRNILLGFCIRDE